MLLPLPLLLLMLLNDDDRPTVFGTSVIYTQQWVQPVTAGVHHCAWR